MANQRSSPRLRLHELPEEVLATIASFAQDGNFRICCKAMHKAFHVAWVDMSVVSQAVIVANERPDISLVSLLDQAGVHSCDDWEKLPGYSVTANKQLHLEARRCMRLGLLGEELTRKGGRAGVRLMCMFPEYEENMAQLLGDDAMNRVAAGDIAWTHTELTRWAERCLGMRWTPATNMAYCVGRHIEYLKQMDVDEEDDFIADIARNIRVWPIDDVSECLCAIMTDSDEVVFQTCKRIFFALVRRVGRGVSTATGAHAAVTAAARMDCVPRGTVMRMMMCMPFHVSKVIAAAAQRVRPNLLATLLDGFGTKKTDLSNALENATLVDAKRSVDLLLTRGARLTHQAALNAVGKKALCQLMRRHAAWDEAQEAVLIDALLERFC